MYIAIILQAMFMSTVVNNNRIYVIYVCILYERRNGLRSRCNFRCQDDLQWRMSPERDPRDYVFFFLWTVGSEAWMKPLNKGAA